MQNKVHAAAGKSNISNYERLSTSNTISMSPARMSNNGKGWINNLAITQTKAQDNVYEIKPIEVLRFRDAHLLS